MGLILNEILSTCFKHAFPPDTAGIIEVVLAPEGADGASIVVEDDWVGLRGNYSGESEHSLEMTLIGTLSGQIGVYLPLKAPGKISGAVSASPSPFLCQSDSAGLTRPEKR